MRHRWVGGKVCAWSDGSEMGHDYRGWVMITGCWVMMTGRWV